MDDLISRQEAYETLSEYYHHRTEIQHKGLREALSRVPSAEPEYTIEMQESDIDKAMKLVRDARVTILPSAEPVRMKGRWETDSYGAMDDGEYLVTRCSVCGTAYEYGHDDRYCGFCGAEMSEGDE